MSQEKLAEALGITFQQVQKYERGLNRISAGRLQEISRVLQAPISFFFGEGKRAEGDEEEQGIGGDLDRQSQRLIRAFRRVQDPRVRTAILGFVEAVAGLGGAVKP